MLEHLFPNRAILFRGDCLALLTALPPNSIDAVITDPPYGLNFMGRAWDRGVPSAHVWQQVLRVCKPGAYLLSFGGTRTYHRMACAIDDAGFEIFDMVQWLHGQGMPKGKNFDGAWKGWGTTLKPASEPIALARKPLVGTFTENLAAHGVGALHIDACRVGTSKAVPASVSRTAGNSLSGSADGSLRRETGQESGHDPNIGRWPANVVHDGSDEVLRNFPQSKGQQGDVKGNEPSHTGDENTACYGEFGRVPFSKREDSGSAARFFNTLRDGEPSANFRYTDEGSTNFAALPGMRREPVEQSRFFYCAKATAKERNGSKHPTIKPVALMRWLVRLITPPNGFILDPFAGTGTTGEAALHEGFRVLMAEADAAHCEDIRRRIQTLTPLQTRC